jgi:hypothetical protein
LLIETGDARKQPARSISLVLADLCTGANLGAPAPVTLADGRGGLNGDWEFRPDLMVLGTISGLKALALEPADGSGNAGAIEVSPRGGSE